MADTPSDSAVSPPAAAHSSDNSRGGFRRRGRGKDGVARSSRARGGRGGRGGRDRQQQRRNSRAAPSVESTATTIELAADKGHTIESGAQSTRAFEPATDDADDGEVCFICASRVAHTSVSPCNHRTCHICALRLRALYKNKACAHCRTESKFVIFTDNPAKRYEDFTEADFSRIDDNLGIEYEKDEIFEDTVLLLRYNCPDRNCDVACLGWPDLHRHVKNKHGKVMCDLCTRNKKVFTHEHELFFMAELRRHEKYGDDVPGAIDQSGFKGHPECGFCRQRFYGDDELYAHCRDRHERCHICDRRSGSRQQQYYIDYNALEEHFQKDHFLCLDKECLEKKFVVFESQMDLKAHQLEAHPNGLSKDARRDARMVDMSTFDFRTPYQPQRQRRGAGRGRDPNSEPLPPSSAQPLRRDEIAYQRQMAIQSAQSVSTRTFGGQLSREDTQTVRAPEQPSSGTSTPTATFARPPSVPVLEMENLTVTADLTPQEQARRLRHTSVIERASNLLHNDPRKLAEFRTRVSSYRSSALTATELIDAFFSLFDTSSSELGKLIKELSEIYEEDTKRNALLKAWNDWRAINEDYPALPGLNGTLPGMFSSSVNGGDGKRVLRLKSSTAQSSRSAVGRSGSLLSSASSLSNTPFPPLSSEPKPSATGPRLPANTTTAWVTPTLSPSPSPSPSRAHPSSSARSPAVFSAPAPSRPSNPEAFPALPTAPKPNVLMAGLTRGTVRWDGRRNASSSNAWGASSSTRLVATGGSGGGADAEQGDLGPSAGGKKGKGKQILFHFG